MKITKTKLREIIKQSIQEEKEYDKYFRGMLAKYGVESPADLSDEEKSKFFSDVDKGWNSKNEGNAFGAAVTAAKEKGEDEFEVDGKTYPVKESFIPKVGTIDKFKLKELLLKNPKVTGILSPKEMEFMKNPKTDVIMHQSKRFNIIVTDGKMEFEVDNKAGKVVKPLTKARKEIVDYYSTNESVNEGKKVFKVNPPIGKVKYSISSHDGVKKHNDGSDFYDIKIFKNKVDLEKGIKKYTSNGFVKESKDFTSIREVIRGIILTESKYDLMFGKLGNGITVSNRKVSDPSTKDYKKVAHISTDGKIQWHDKDAQRDSKVRREVEKHAKKMN